MKSRFFSAAAGLLAAATLSLAISTARSMRPLPERFDAVAGTPRKLQVLDRTGRPMNITYENDWNIHDVVCLHEIPELLKKAFIVSEDKRFFKHNGPDWTARIKALFQNIAALRAVRGASTITEQVVRMINSRPRTLWSRWVEGFEAASLEKRFSKADILEFYLNQVPYASRRRGVVQAARHYFDRELDTLSPKEMLALAVLVRAPSRMDPLRDARASEGAINRLAGRMEQQGFFSSSELVGIESEPLKLSASKLEVNARNFVREAIITSGASGAKAFIKNATVKTTLDALLQEKVQALLDGRLRDLWAKGAINGAALVVDYETDEILAWCVGAPEGMGKGGSSPGSLIDAVLAARQPGSTLKPFVYAAALEKGWSAATLIDDSPFSEPVGRGIHDYRNYSRVYYGPVSLRAALGNSLNVPAVKAARFVGAEGLLEKLRLLGFESLTSDAAFYGDGLALGNGEVSLYELVRAYSAMARGGRFEPLKLLAESAPSEARQVFSGEITSIIADILSDPEARSLEFGREGLLNFPVQTAVKTGTSSDYRDAWAVGFNDRYAAGVWMGDLSGKAMDAVTGSLGPALVLRGIFNELNKNRQTRPLRFDRRLVSRQVCVETGLLADSECASRIEWFVPGTEPGAALTNRKGLEQSQSQAARVKLLQPVDGLQMAMDPRIPDKDEAFEFKLESSSEIVRTDWRLDGKVIKTNGATCLWPMKKGEHRLSALAWEKGGVSPLEAGAVVFVVK